MLKTQKETLKKFNVFFPKRIPRTTSRVTTGGVSEETYRNIPKRTLEEILEGIPEGSPEEIW